MNQQINLYQPIFRKQKKVFTAVAMLQVCLISIALFTLAGGYSYFQLKKLQEQENRVAEKLIRSQAHFKQLLGKTGTDATAKLLTAEISKLNQELEQKKSIVALLAQGSYVTKRGFSQQFEAIARQHVNGTWLTRIEIEQGGAALNLKGITYSAELVPVYLQRLLQEQVFSETTFNLFGMQRSVESPEEISFQVGTKSEGKPNGSS